MNFRYIKISKMLFYIFLLVFKNSFGQECDSHGVNCISCTEYRNCNAGSLKERIISCTEGDGCVDNQLKQRQIKLNCYAINECTQAGIFPDVTVDSNYYVCLNDAGSGFLKYEFSCPEGNFFDKASLTCVPREVTVATETTEVPSSPVSTNPTSPSTSVSPTSPSTPTDPTSPSSSTNPTPSSTSMSPTSPSMSTDPTSPSSSTNPTPSSTSMSPTSPSTSTDPTSPSSSTNPTPSSTSTTSATPTSSTTPPVPSPTTPPFACIAPGIFPDPVNCKMYYRCSTSLKAFFYICPGNSYFNENILKCSMIISPACQEQILKNSTSTVSPTIPAVTITAATTSKPLTTTSTSIITSTVTSAPTITITTAKTTSAPTTNTPATTTATTTIAPSSTPFSCPMSGVFADPLSCKTYYRCALSGKIFQYVCPGNTYFNEFTKRCGLIMTPRCKSLIQG